jgi:hypothetical protein
MNIKNCKTLQIPKISSPRGSLSVIEDSNILPFEIRRVYYLYDIPAGESRGGHAHKILEQLIIPISGSFDVKINDGSHEKVITLNRPNVGLYICPYIWRELDKFSSGSVCLVLASQPYDESDYFRNYEEFLLEIGKLK